MFISHELFDKNGSGEYLNAFRKALTDLYGIENVFCINIDDQIRECSDKRIRVYYEKKNNIQKVANLLYYGATFLTKTFLSEVEELINQEEIDVVILARSSYGGIIRTLKKRTNATVVTIFHDIFPEILRQGINMYEAVSDLKIVSNLMNQIQLRCEKKSVLFSDATVVLNEREKKLYQKYYKKTPTVMIPIFCRDRFDRNRLIEKEQNDDHKLKILFIGTYYKPNIDGITWFIKEVLEHLEIECILYLVGRGLEKLSDDPVFINERIKVIGSVESVDEWYYRSDVVIAPILEGTGMKTKTVEALMFGKTYFGSPEAMCGFDGLEDMICKTSQDYVDKLTKYSFHKSRKKFHEEIRTLYEKEYAIDVIKRRVDAVIQMVGRKR